VPRATAGWIPILREALSKGIGSNPCVRSGYPYRALPRSRITSASVSQHKARQRLAPLTATLATRFGLMTLTISQYFFSMVILLKRTATKPVDSRCVCNCGCKLLNMANVSSIWKWFSVRARLL